LRWLDDLPENSSQKTITGKGLAFQILTGNPDYEYSRDTKPIPPDLSYEDYLKQSCPKLKPSKYFLKNPQVWAYMFLFIFVLFAAILTPPLFDLIKNLIGSIAWLKSIDNLVENISKILFFLFIFIISFLLWRVFVIISNFKWSGFQKKSFWDWLQLLIVPLMLALGAFYLNSAADFRDYQIAQERKQQEILTDYFSKMQDLIVETKKIKETPSSKESNPEERLLLEFRPTAQALTLSVLEQLDGKRKGKVITYLAESQLINKIDPLIQLGGANLQKLELKGRQVFSSINIVGANMTATELSDILISDSDLSTVNLTEAVLQDVTFENSNLSGINLDGASLTNVSLEKNNKYQDACYSNKNSLSDRETLSRLGFQKIKPGSNDCKLKGGSIDKKLKQKK
jgi:uncharacterized protein YjbI with pentapeptide repeats